jgi:hypothetical protein
MKKEYIVTKMNVSCKKYYVGDIMKGKIDSVGFSPIELHLNGILRIFSEPSSQYYHMKFVKPKKISDLLYQHISTVKVVNTEISDDPYCDSVDSDGIGWLNHRQQIIIKTKNGSEFVVDVVETMASFVDAGKIKVMYGDNELSPV